MRVAARVAAALAFVAALASFPTLLFSAANDPQPGRWEGTFVPNGIFNELLGPNLVSRQVNPRWGRFGSESCNVGYTSGSPGVNPITVVWGASPKWIDYEIDLEQYENQAVSIRFVFWAMDEFFNKHEGWFIDDIEITNLVRPPDPVNAPGDRTWRNGAETQAERNWMLAHSTYGEKPGWHATQFQAHKGQWSWWYGSDDTGTYEARGKDGKQDPTPGDTDNPPLGQAPGFEDDRCNDGPSTGALMTPVLELGENPKLRFSTRWETEGVLPVADIKVINIAVDADKDGLLDLWEVEGIDLDADDEVDFRLEDLHPFPPDWEHKDLYVEIDCMEVGPNQHTDCPQPGALSRAVEAMEFTPVFGNPDGLKGITLHPYVSQKLPHEPVTDMLAPTDRFFAIKDQHFDERHRCCTHYSLWAHSQSDERINGKLYSVLGRGNKRGPDTLMSVYEKNPPGTPEQFAHRQAATFLHELGHNIGLDHGGFTAVNNVPHYLSLMNYRYGDGVEPEVETPFQGGNDDGSCDVGEQCELQLLFSEVPFGLIDESSLDEVSPNNGGINLPIPNAEAAPGVFFTHTCPGTPRREIGWSMALAIDYGVNWDCITNQSSPNVLVAAFSLTPVEVDVNADIRITPLLSEMDAPFMDLIFGDDKDFASGAAVTLPEEFPGAVQRRFSDPAGDQRQPDAAVTGGLTGTNGHPAVRIDVRDLPNAARPAAEVSGIRSIHVTGANVAPIELFFAEEPATLETSVEVESNDGAPPVFRAELRDMAANLLVVEYPPVVDALPPVARLQSVAAGAAQFEIRVEDDTAVAATNPALLQNVELLEVSGDRQTGFVLRFAKLDPGAPPIVQLDVLDPSGNRTELVFDPADALDSDADGVPDVSDVCPDVADPEQADANGDGVGDACTSVVLADLAGLTLPAATAALEAASLRLGGVSTAHHPTALPDTVLAQLPGAGGLVPLGAPIELVVSSGPELVSVPALIGFARTTAEAALLDAGFALGPVSEQNDRNVPAGVLLAQTVAAGTLLAKGSSVGITISLGPRSVVVPAVTGLAQAAAQAALVAADLVTGVVSTANHASVPEGAVISQSPIAGISRPEGSAVDLVVSSGPVLTTVPDLTGLDLNAAFVAAGNANLFLARFVHTNHPTAPVGLVFAQAPAPGARVPVQSEVEVTLSLGPVAVNVLVPSVVGFSSLQTSQILALSKLNAGTPTQAFSDTVLLNRVISQSPVAGTSVAQGSAVDYVLSKGPEFAPVFSVTKTGPQTVQPGERFSYNIAYSNTGNRDAQSTVVTDLLPANLDFVSASNGGVFNSTARTVSWPVGALAPGAGGAVSLDVRRQCGTGVSTNRARAQASNAALVEALFSTQVTPAPAGPLDVSVENLPDSVPLPPGGAVTYAIHIHNGTAADYRVVTLPLAAPSATNFETVVQAGGGEVDTTNPRFWTWRGRVPPNADLDIVLRARLQACVPGSSEAIQLRNIALQNCAGVIGRAPDPEAIPIEQPVVVHLSTPGLLPTAGGAPGFTPGGPQDQPVRSGKAVAVRLAIENTTAQVQSGVSISSRLPFGLLPVSDPPFVAPVDPGASWSATTRTAAWNGTLAAHETRTLTLQVRTDPASGECRMDLTASGSAAGCSSNVFGLIDLLAVPEVPDASHLVGLDGTDGLWQLRPGIDAAPQTLLCPSAEVLNGFGRGPQGSVYVAGYPSFHFDPGLPQLEFFGPEFYAEVGGSAGPQDVAYDATTTPPSLVFVGDKVWRYHIESGAIETILDDPTLGSVRSVQVDSGGQILALADAGLVRIDPTGPLPLPQGSYELLSGSVSFSFDASQLGGRQPDAFVAFDVDAAGNALAVHEATFLKILEAGPPLVLQQTTLDSLVRFGLPGGLFSVLREVVAGRVVLSSPPYPPVPAFTDPLLQISGNLTAAAVGAPGDLFVGSQFPGAIAVLHSGPPVTGEVLVAESASRSTQDLAWVAPAPKCSAPLDLAARAKPGKVDLTFTPSVVAEYAVLRAAAGSSGFMELGRAANGIYVDFTAVSGQSYDYALDTLCRDLEVLRSASVRANVPTSDGRRGAPPAAAPPPAEPPPSACGLLGIEAPLALWIARAWRRSRGAQSRASAS